LERRRPQAADLFAQGKTRAEVTGELGVSAQTASRWYVRWRGGGAAGMRTARHGKPARLGPAELAKLRRVLDRGAVAARLSMTAQEVSPVMRCPSGTPAPRTGSERNADQCFRWSGLVVPPQART
jgi:transposase